jgi:hypothetical protein
MIHSLSLYKVRPSNKDGMSHKLCSHLLDIRVSLVHNLKDHVVALAWLIKYLYLALL